MLFLAPAELSFRLLKGLFLEEGRLFALDLGLPLHVFLLELLVCLFALLLFLLEYIEVTKAALHKVVHFVHHLFFKMLFLSSCLAWRWILTTCL